MCMICDGFTYDDMARSTDLLIRVHGWMLQHVEPDGEDCGGFGYSIGLLESYGHPELVAMDLHVEAQSHLLRPLVEMVQSAGALDHQKLTAAGIEVVEVLPEHLGTDLFGAWMRRYGHAPPPGSVLQLIPPDCWYCPEHGGRVRRLDQPGTFLGHAPACRPNRAQRRQAQRSRRRRPR